MAVISRPISRPRYLASETILISGYLRSKRALDRGLGSRVVIPTVLSRLRPSPEKTANIEIMSSAVMIGSTLAASRARSSAKA